jgi:uncharacterized membrane protein
MMWLLLMIFSTPVLIYVILFYPELKQPVTRGILLNDSEEGENISKELPFECLLAMVAAGAVALMFGLLVDVSWQVCLMLMCTAAALIGGIAFTALQLRSLGFPPPAGGPDRIGVF